MLWISVDPAAHTGVAIWRGSTLVEVATLGPASKAEVKRYGKGSLVVHRLARGLTERRTCLFATDHSAWSYLLISVCAVVVEEGFGPSAKTVAQHAERRGFIRAMCAARTIPFHVVNVSEWRKVVGQGNGFAFPRESALAKARAMELIAPMIGSPVSDDEADAACAGLWALATRTVQP